MEARIGPMKYHLEMIRIAMRVDVKSKNDGNSRSERISVWKAETMPYRAEQNKRVYLKWCYKTGQNDFF